MLKRYIVFTPVPHEARGGWDDILRDKNHDTASFDTIEEAVTTANLAVKESPFNPSFHVVDLHSGEAVEYG
jgi:hypothetical protein